MIKAVSSHNICPGCSKPSFGSIMPIKFVNRSTGETVKASQDLINNFTLSLMENGVDNSLRGFMKRADVHDFAKDKPSRYLDAIGFDFKKSKTGDYVMLTGEDKVAADKEFTFKNITDYWKKLKDRKYSGRELVVQVVPTNSDRYITKAISANKISPNEFLKKMIERF